MDIGKRVRHHARYVVKVGLQRVKAAHKKLCVTVIVNGIVPPNKRLFLCLGLVNRPLHDIVAYIRARFVARPHNLYVAMKRVGKGTVIKVNAYLAALAVLGADGNKRLYVALRFNKLVVNAV